MQFQGTYPAERIDSVRYLLEDREQQMRQIGCISKIPILLWLFAKIGDIHLYRKHAIVIILVVAAIITPTLDVFTLSLAALPMWILYEISIWIVKNSIVNEDSFAA